MNVLIIDDNPICNLLSRRIAETLGIFTEIKSVYQVKEALDYFEEVCKGTIEGPNLILLDLHMPVMNGFDFLEAFHQLKFPDKKNPAVVILTASQEPGDVERAREMGISDYLLKSLAVKDLQTALFSVYKKALGNQLTA